MRAFVFPGQGSQFIGMGKDLYENFDIAKQVFDEVDNALDQKLSSLIFDGDAAELNMTENTQPALMAVSVAITRILQQEFNLDLFNSDVTKFVAGHSLGEYSALTAVNALSLEASAKLLKIRGQAMQKAVPAGIGSMAAILGLEIEDIKAITDGASLEGNICVSANDNSYGQIVVSGHKSAVERAVELATEKGAKRAVILPVSAPFHCPLMQPAADAMAEALANINIQTPELPIIANVTAKPVIDGEDIKKLLVEQVTGMVRWRETILYMGESNIDEIIELGAGKVLTGLTKRINKEIKGATISSVDTIKKFIEA